MRKLAEFGLTDAQIASALSVGEATLQRRARAPLTSGRTKGHATLARALFRMAISGKCPAATIFLAKCRLGMREVQRDDMQTIEKPQSLALE